MVYNGIQTLLMLQRAVQTGGNDVTFNPVSTTVVRLAVCLVARFLVNRALYLTCHLPLQPTASCKWDGQHGQVCSLMSHSVYTHVSVPILLPGI